LYLGAVLESGCKNKIRVKGIRLFKCYGTEFYKFKIDVQENNDLSFRSEYDFQKIAEGYLKLICLDNNAPSFSPPFF